MSKSTYFYNVSLLNKADKYEDLKSKIKAVFEKHKGRYGNRKITIELNEQSGDKKLNRKLVAKLMKEMNLEGKRAQAKKYKSYIGSEYRKIPNLLRVKIYDSTTKKFKWVHKFKPENPYAVFATDISVFVYRGIHIYYSVLLDLFNQEPVAHTFSLNPTAELAIEMIQKAINAIGLDKMKEAIIHSDQGIQYTSNEYMSFLKDNGFIQSMSRRGKTVDNIIPETYFSRMKREM